MWTHVSVHLVIQHSSSGLADHFRDQYGFRFLPGDGGASRGWERLRMYTRNSRLSCVNQGFRTIEIIFQVTHSLTIRAKGGNAIPISTAPYVRR